MKYWIMCIAFALSVPTTAWAKRKAPEAVKPVVHGDIEYRVKHWGNQRGRVEAYNTKTKKVLWSKVVYATKYDKKLERDVQDVFIKTMTRKGDLLHITNEKGHQYTLNIKTQAVTTVKGPPAPAKSKKSSCSALSTNPPTNALYLALVLLFLSFGTKRRNG